MRIAICSGWPIPAWSNTAPISGHYDLGSEIVELGVAALGKVDAVRFASEALAPLADETGLAALIAVWGTNGPTVIRCEQAGLVSAVRVREGRNLSLLHSAAGRVFLTYLPEVRHTALSWNGNSACRQGTRCRPKTSRRCRPMYAEHGIGRGLGEETPNIAALAAPVFGANGRLALCIGVVSAIGFDTGYSGKPAVALDTRRRRPVAPSWLLQRQSLLAPEAASVSPAGHRAAAAPIF